MELYSGTEHYKLYHGNMLDILEVIEPNTISSIVTDPPYELNFMGKGWDNSGIAFQKDTWKKCLKVLKPGGYLLAFGGSRTYHRIACAIEDAGFEIRDCIMWLYGSGFPKSLSLSKSIEGKLTVGSANTTEFHKLKGDEVDVKSGYTKMEYDQGNKPANYQDRHNSIVNVEYTTELAKQYNGWGTALKPSYEPIIVARKPLEGSCTDNVIKYGVGGINIDECRVGTEELHNQYAGNKNSGFTSGDNRDSKGKGMFSGEKQGETVVNGRFPANTILTYGDDDKEEVCSGFPNSKGASSQNNYSNGHIYRGQSLQESKTSLNGFRERYNDEGSAARYFYCAKASKRDRDEGLQEFETKSHAEINNRKEGSAGAERAYGGGTNPYLSVSSPRKNTHPTVKPCDLMQYLVRLVTPNGGTVLDPFNGSGSTGKAVMYENKDRNKNYKYIGIELTEEYLPIAKARIEYAINVVEEDSKELDKQQPLFDI